MAESGGDYHTLVTSEDVLRVLKLTLILPGALSIDRIKAYVQVERRMLKEQAIISESRTSKTGEAPGGGGGGVTAPAMQVVALLLLSLHVDTHLYSGETPIARYSH